MSLPENLLKKLACPKCKERLEYDRDKSRLKCNRCRLEYRITDNVPVLLLDEAEKF